MTVGEMLDRMSAAEYATWMAVARIEPMGEYRADLRAGIVSSTIFNMNRGKSTAARSPKDFMPIQRDQERWVKEHDPMALEKDLIAHFQAHNRTRKK